MATELLNGPASTQTAIPQLTGSLGVPVAPTPQPQTQSSGDIPAGLDPTVVNVARAIRSTETNLQGNFTAQGASGEYGAYQFEPATWNALAPKAGVTTPLEQATPQEQNAVAYSYISSLKAQGYNVGQIASIWNSGKPDPTGNVGTNAEGVAYNTPQYVQNVYNTYTQLKGQTQTQAGVNQPATPQAPSVGGFLGNVVSSGANFAGNLINAIAHPLQTGQNLLETGAGALDEVGGQTNDDTAKFDNLKNYFVQRYGGISNLEHTVYTDPIGFAADLSTVFGVGGGAVGLASKAADVAGLSDVADVVGDVAGGLNKASALTNPLTPAVVAGGALLNKSADLSDIIANPQNYSPEEMAKAAPEKIVNDVEEAFAAKQSALSETGSGYDPIRQGTSESTGISQGGTNQIPVAHDFLENQLRTVGKLDVVDGKIVPTTVSTLEKSDLPKLQSILDTYKPAFQSGHISPEEFLALRSKLADAAYNENGIKNTNIAKIADGLRDNLNTEYRPSIPGLSELDESYSAQRNNLNDLKDGIIYKTGSNKGELKTSFLNSAMKAVKNEDTDKLGQLEQILPGITKRLQIAKTIKDLGDPSFTTSLVEKGGVVGGLLTGNIKGAALALTSIILSKPAIAIPLLRAVGANMELIKTVMANLAKSLTTGAVSNNVENTMPQNTSPQATTDQQQPTTPSPTVQSESPSTNDSTSSPGYQEALAAGYSPQEIQQYLATQ